MSNEKILAFNGIYHDYETDKIFLTETVESDGKIKKVRSSYPVENFYYQKDPTGKSPIKDIFGEPMIRSVARDRYSLRELAKSGAKLAESDLAPDIKFLHSRYEGMELNPKAEYYNIAYLDIELASGNTFTKEDIENTVYPINLISVKFSSTGEIFVFGSNEYPGLDNYYWIPDEKRLIEEFMRVFRKHKPDVVSGYNSRGFDVPYILNRATKVLGITDTMSYLNKDEYNKYKKTWTIAGTAQLDYIEFFRDMKFHQERLPSYSLQAVAMKELGEGKLEFEGSINTIYKTDWKKFVDYNIQDMLLVEKLEKKNKFIELSINICHKSLIPFEKVFSAIAIVEGIMLTFLHEKNQVLPDRKKSGRTSDDAGEGGYVEAHPGYYQNLLSFDFASLYPSIIMLSNISLETKVSYPSEDMKKNLIKTVVSDSLGVYYKKEKGIMPSALETFFKQRKEYKKLKLRYEAEGNKELAEFYDTQQKIIKVINNSFFGCVGNEHSHFYDLEMANTITLGGQHIIQHMRDSLQDFFKNNFGKLSKIYPQIKENDSIRGRMCHLIDTDSIYLDINEIKQKVAPDEDLVVFANDFNDRVLSKLFKRILDNYISATYGVENKMDFKLEKIISQMVIFGKKNYATETLSNEGVVYETPKMTVTGFASKRSDRPFFCRKKINEVLDIFFAAKNKDKSQIVSVLRRIKTEFRQEKIEEISNPKGLTDYDKYDKGMEYYLKHGLSFYPSTPIHNRAAIVYNYIVAKNGLSREMINTGSKMKFIYVNERNPYKSNVIGYIGNWPEEFNKIFKIDYQLQFEKTFLSTIQILFNSLGWGRVDLDYEEEDFIS